MAKLTTLAVIPARGGSKGLARKNIRPLGGKPLIAYSIEAAKACPGIDRVLVSTDDPEIAAVAKSLGAEVPFLRPAFLAGDRVIPGRVVGHMLRTLYSGRTKDMVIVLLYPTHPFRPPGLLDLLLDKVHSGYALARTVRPIETFPDSFVRLDATGHIATLPGPGAVPQVYFRPYGLAEASWVRPPGPSCPSYCHVIRDKACLVDIDYLEDLHLAEMILANNLFPFC